MIIAKLKIRNRQFLRIGVIGIVAQFTLAFPVFEEDLPLWGSLLNVGLSTLIVDGLLIEGITVVKEKSCIRVRSSFHTTHTQYQVGDDVTHHITGASCLEQNVFTKAELQILILRPQLFTDFLI